MFGLKRKRALQSGVSAVISSPEGLGGAEERWYSTIWRNTALGRDEFDLTYGAFLNLSLDYLDTTPQGGWPGSEYHEVRSRTLTMVNTALRIRQAHIIPRGVASEDASRLGEVMSFVIAVAVVLEQVNKFVGAFKFENEGPRWCPLVEAMPVDAEIVGHQTLDPTFALLLLSRLVSEAGLRWITQEPEAMNELLLYFKGDRRSAIAPVLDMAKAKVGHVQRREPRRDTHEEVSCDVEAIPAQQQPPDALSARESGVEPIIEARKGEEAVSAPKEPPEAITAVSQVQSSMPTTTAKTGERAPAKGYLYLNWLRGQLDNGNLVPNQADSLVHVLDDGTVLLRVPEAFHPYVDGKGVTAKQAQNQLVRLDQHRIKKDGKDIFVGRGADGKKIAGLVLKNADVLWPANRPAVSTAVTGVR